jgi:hypothetical protein
MGCTIFICHEIGFSNPTCSHVVVGGFYHIYFPCALDAVGQSCVIWFSQDALYLFVTKLASQIPIAKSMGLAQLINKAW